MAVKRDSGFRPVSYTSDLQELNRVLRGMNDEEKEIHFNRLVMDIKGMADKCDPEAMLSIARVYSDLSYLTSTHRISFELSEILDTNLLNIARSFSDICTCTRGTAGVSVVKRK